MRPVSGSRRVLGAWELRRFVGRQRRLEVVWRMLAQCIAGECGGIVRVRKRILAVGDFDHLVLLWSGVRRKGRKRYGRDVL